LPSFLYGIITPVPVYLEFANDLGSVLQLGRQHCFFKVNQLMGWAKLHDVVLNLKKHYFLKKTGDSISSKKY